MDINAALLKEHSKENSLEIVNYIGDDASRFEELMKLFLDGNYKLNQRAAWVVNFCWEKNASLIEPYIEEMVKLLNKDRHDGVKRNVLRIFQSHEIDEYLHGQLLDSSMKLLMDRNESIAIRVFSMTVANNLAKLYPEIKQELKAYLSVEIDYGSAGFKSRAKKILNSAWS